MSAASCLSSYLWEHLLISFTKSLYWLIYEKNINELATNSECKYILHVTYEHNMKNIW